MRPSLPGDLTYLDTDYTVVSTANSLNFSESGWWGNILSGNEGSDSNFHRFVGCVCFQGQRDVKNPKKENKKSGVK